MLLRAARIIEKMLSKLTSEEEFEYWKTQTKALHEEQKKVMKKAASKRGYQELTRR